jgi:hypothetical protein
MARVKTVSGYYGGGHTPCDVFVYEDLYGNWYVVEGGSVVNFTPDEVNDGVDVETLYDTDVFTWTEGIHSEEDLEEAVEA